MRTKNPKIDGFLKKAGRWREATEELRRIALDSGLNEEFKWGKSCYAFEGSNVAIIQGFKEHCAFMFFKGALLKDPDGLLQAPGPNSRVARRMEFADVDAVVTMEDRLRAFIADAIEIEKAGLEVAPPKDPGPLPDELVQMFEKVAGLRKAFGGLTPGRQREYALHFSGAKQSKTRRSRIEKYAPKILEGKGFRD